MNITTEQFVRLANKFYLSRGLNSDINQIAFNADLINFAFNPENAKQVETKYKVAFCIVCLNPMYWQYILPLMNSARQFFLPGHQTDFLIWSDLPEHTNKAAYEAGFQETYARTIAVNNPLNHPQIEAELRESFRRLQEKPIDATVYPTEAVEWPHPTLLRYNLMLQEEEKLKEYDYVFYCDVDMLFVNIVGDEILGDRLTAVQQPMYATRKEWIPPYEPNPKSASYIPRLGRITNDNGSPRFVPLYVAGGFQGGKSKDWIKAMQVMKQKIDSDMTKLNYVPIWNDETVWNSYLFENLDDRDVILTPSYTYPDSLHKEYFIPMWGRDYQPKLVTLTKKFSFQPGAGEHLVKMLNETKTLQP